MLHLHFGAGRLGFGLVAPYFQTPDSELFLLNRAVSGVNPTGSTTIGPSRRNELLATNPVPEYLIEPPGSYSGQHTQAQVKYKGFFDYGDDVAGPINAILERSTEKAKGIIVTGRTSEVAALRAHSGSA